MFKIFLKKLINPALRYRVKAILGSVQLDEVKLIYDILREVKIPQIMIDVGAHYGESLEIFARDGWHVYAFEPDAKNRAILNELCHRLPLPSVTIDSHAVSNKNEQQQSFYTSDISTGISGLSAFHASHKETTKVETVTLDAFCQNIGIKEIGFLKIDTEGFDLFVLQGCNWEQIKPQVILCEFEDRKTLPLGYNFHDLANFLTEKHYKLLVSEWYPLIEYGTQHRWRRFSQYPCELFEKSAWGNIIAVKEDEVFLQLCAKAEEYGNKFS